jgi:hypothetical protein
MEAASGQSVLSKAGGAARRGSGTPPRAVPAAASNDVDLSTVDLLWFVFLGGVVAPARSRL